LSRGNPTLEVGDGSGHLGVGCKRYAAALDLDRPHPAKARSEQHIALRRHLFEGHAWSSLNSVPCEALCIVGVRRPCA
jgi:hypothetical protein